MKRRQAMFAVPIALALVVAGCGSAPAPADDPVISGRRVQSVAVAARGPVPSQVGAYELVFAERAGVSQARRAVLVIDLFGERGRAQGFAEWGRSGEAPKTYVVGGWARKRSVDGQVLTVFDLALSGLDPGEAPARDPRERVPVDVRVVVNEGSGDVTLTRRR
jgi:hypothetical protein